MHLTRTEPDANLYRFYRMEIVRGLFGDWGLVREWGRIGQCGQTRTDWFTCEANACEARRDLQVQKIKRGYFAAPSPPIEQSNSRPSEEVGRRSKIPS